MHLLDVLLPHEDIIIIPACQQHASFVHLYNTSLILIIYIYTYSVQVRYSSRGLEEDTYSSNSFSFRSHKSTKTPTVTIEGIQNRHFNQEETSDSQPPTPTTPPSAVTKRDTGGMVRVPSASGSRQVGSTGSTRSMPDETMNASNRVAPSEIHSSTAPGAVCYQTAL